MAKVEDVEMAKKKKEDEPNGPYSDLQPPTEYQPINWKKIFLTPKYIRMFVLLLLLLLHYCSRSRTICCLH